VTEEKGVIQVKVSTDLLRKIRDVNSDYKLVPAVFIADIAMQHFLDELKQKKEA
jgi:hypothetical protein